MKYALPLLMLCFSMTTWAMEEKRDQDIIKVELLSMKEIREVAKSIERCKRKKIIKEDIMNLLDVVFPDI